MRKNSLIKMIATVGFVGYLPFAPGTFGSLAGIFLYLLVKNFPAIYFTVTLCTLIVGFYVADKVVGVFGKDDPKEVVIDELSGILIVYLFLPFSVTTLLSGFLIFRLLDIIKIPPIKRVERLPGGYGIMLDDVLAGVVTNILLHIILFCY